MSYDETKFEDRAIMERCRRIFADFGLADRVVVGKEPTLLLEEWHLLHSQVFALFTRGPLAEALGLAWSLASLDEQDTFLCNVVGCTTDELTEFVFNTENANRPLTEEDRAAFRPTQPAGPAQATAIEQTPPPPMRWRKTPTQIKLPI